MDETQSSTPLNHHGTPLLRILALLVFALTIAIVSSLITYYFIGKQSQMQLQNYPQPTAAPIPTITLSPPVQKPSSSYKPNILKDWTTVKSSECNVIFPLPPKKEPYSYPETESDFNSGRMWKYSHQTSKSENGTMSESVDISYLRIDDKEPGGDYLAGRVNITCQQNLRKSNQEVFEAIKRFQENSGNGPYYEFKRNESKWGNDVLVYLVRGQFDIEHYIFSSGKFTYDISYYSGSEKQFVKDTTKQIFDNLEFF